MKVFKFGGASVKDADGVKNVVRVLEQVGHQNVLLVISAMGKTTNAFEIVIKNYFDKSNELQSSIQDVKKYHNQILLELFEDENYRELYFMKNPTADPKLSKVLKALKVARESQIPNSSVSLLNINCEVNLTGDDYLKNKFFVREFYDKLFTHLRSLKKVTLIGNPGIGKSLVFICIFLSDLF